MGRREIVMTEWFCDVCSQTQIVKKGDRPTGWIDGPTVKWGTFSKVLELCPQCAADPTTAAERWKQQHAR